MTINPDVDGNGLRARWQADRALVSDGAQLHGLHPLGFDPSRIPLLREMCAARAGARKGYYCKPGEGFEKAHLYGERWAPKLGKHYVSLIRHHYYATREDALAAAREYRRRCREMLAAIAIEAGTAATVKQGAVRSTKARAEGIARTARP